MAGYNKKTPCRAANLCEPVGLCIAGNYSNLPTIHREALAVNTRNLSVIMLISLGLLAPAFVLGAGGGDLHLQSLWTRFFAAQLWHGDLYPRWLMDMYAGNGSPVFFYYPPLAYYFSALFSFLSPLDAFGYTPLAVSTFFAVAASGLAFYGWMREEGVEAPAALLGSACYMAVPFHVGQCFYYVLLYSSVWAYAWVPLLMLAAGKLGEGRRNAVAGFALALGLLILTNNAMTIIFGPLAVAYALLRSTRGRGAPLLVRLAAAVVLGFGLSAIFLLPEIAYKRYATVDLTWSDPYGGQEVFLTPGFANPEQAWYSLVWFSVLGLTLLLYVAAGRQRLKERNFCLAASLAALAMMLLYIGKPLWEVFPVLKLLQHPARFFAVPALCLSWLAAFTSAGYRRWLMALIACFICITAVIAWQAKKSMQDFRRQQPADYARYMLNIDQYPAFLTLPSLVHRYYSEEGLSEVQKHTAKVEVLKGDAQASVETWQPRLITLHVSAHERSLLRIRQHYFPGFRAFRGREELEAGFDEKTGQVTVDVPPGSGEVRLVLTQLLPEMAGKLVSMASAAVVALMLLLGLRKNSAP